MKKDFDNWNKKKKELNLIVPNFYKIRDVRWCSFGVNIGFEQDGTTKSYKRPALIISGFSRNLCLVVPLTTVFKKNKYYVPLGKIGDKESFAIISQLKAVDCKRIHDRISVLNKNLFEDVRKAIRNLI